MNLFKSLISKILFDIQKGQQSVSRGKSLLLHLQTKHKIQNFKIVARKMESHTLFDLCLKLIYVATIVFREN